jgi:hypothetical protein
MSSFDRYRTALLEGDTTPLASVPSGTGGRTGVFTLWYRDELLYLGRSLKEPSKTKNRQADGVTGRLRMIRRQPPVSIQRALKATWPEDVRSAPGTTDRQRTSHALIARAHCRLVRLATGAESEALYQELKDHLDAAGRAPLADRYR